MRIMVTAPGARIPPETAGAVIALAQRVRPELEIVFHPQCFRSHGHFAGTDAERSDAFVEAANDPEVDAVWFGRGGYGSARMVEASLPRLGPRARDKSYLGYSDMGTLLAGLYKSGFTRLAHGPLCQDLVREGGEAAIVRALDWFAAEAPSSLEPSVDGSAPTAAFNITILSCLIGTPLQPDLSGHVLMLEEVSEHLYRIDRLLCHITSNPQILQVKGVRLGRCSLIPDNDPPFAIDEEAIAREWCERSGIAWLGRADIGHDADNKVVPFGMWRGR